MPKVIYVATDGTQRAIDATAGDSVMATAVQHGVPGVPQLAVHTLRAPFVWHCRSLKQVEFSQQGWPCSPQRMVQK